MQHIVKRPAGLIGAACFLLAISFQAFAYRDPITTDTGLQGRVQVSLVMSALLLGFVAMYKFTGRIRITLPLVCFAIYVSLGLISSPNSFSLYISFAKGVLVMATLMFAALAVSSAGYETTVASLYWAMIAVIVAGLILGVLLPRTFPLFFFSDLQSDVGEWRLRLGLFKTHPITVADICALTFLLGLGRKGKWVWLAQAIALCCTVATVSRGSIAALTAILVIRFLWLSPLRTSVPVVGVLMVAIATPFIAGYRADDLARFLPRQITAAYQASADDPELDGRVPLWTYAVTIMNDHLPFGFGFDGARMKLMNRFEWAGHSHNSFLETWLISGPIGLVAFMAGWLITIVRNSRQPAGHLFLPIHAYLAITSLIGPATTGNAGPGLLLLAVAAMVPRPSRECSPALNIETRNLVYFPETLRPAHAPLRSGFPGSDWQP
jgi:hypothetical protein